MIVADLAFFVRPAAGVGPFDDGGRGPWRVIINPL
jgi:hypothetical protein